VAGIPWWVALFALLFALGVTLLVKSIVRARALATVELCASCNHDYESHSVWQKVDRTEPPLVDTPIAYPVEVPCKVLGCTCRHFDLVRVCGCGHDVSYHQYRDWGGLRYRSCQVGMEYTTTSHLPRCGCVAFRSSPGTKDLLGPEPPSTATDSFHL